MPKFFVTLSPMPADQVTSACRKVLVTSAGTGLRTDAAYVDTALGQPMCFWDAPDRGSVVKLFARAGVKPESVREVMPYHA